MRIIILIFLAASVSLFSVEVEVIKTYDNKVSYKITGSDYIVLSIRNSNKPKYKLKLDSIPPANEFYGKRTSMAGDSNYIVFKGEPDEKVKFIHNLDPCTKYGIDIYYGNSFETLYFITKAIEPESVTPRIYWQDLDTTSVKFHFSPGAGENRLVAISAKDNKFAPLDRKNYKSSSTYGNGDTIDGHAYVVLGESDTVNHILLEELEPGTRYFINSYEFNGSGDCVNYLEDLELNVNSIRLSTIPSTPVVNKPIELSDGLRVTWNRVKGVERYEFEVAFDKGFTKMTEYYNKVDVGTAVSFEFLHEDFFSGKDYYFRIRAIGESGNSEYSEIVKLK